MAGLAVLEGFTRADALLMLDDETILRRVKGLPGVGPRQLALTSEWLHAQRLARGGLVSPRVRALAAARDGMDALKQQLVGALRDAVTSGNWSIAEVALFSGTSRNVVEQLLTDTDGSAPLPQIDLLMRLAATLGLNVALVPARQRKAA